MDINFLLGEGGPLKSPHRGFTLGEGSPLRFANRGFTLGEGSPLNFSGPTADSRFFRPAPVGGTSLQLFKGGPNFMITEDGGIVKLGPTSQSQPRANLTPYKGQPNYTITENGELISKGPTADSRVPRSINKVVSYKGNPNFTMGQGSRLQGQPTKPTIEQLLLEDKKGKAFNNGDFSTKANKPDPQYGRLKPEARAAKNAGTKLMRASTAKGIAKTALPYVGDVADIGMGWHNVTNGHPFIGLGQIGLGGTGAVLDTLGLLGLGAGTATGVGTPAGVTTYLTEQALKKGLKKAIKGGAKNLVKLGMNKKRMAAQQGLAAGLELAKGIEDFAGDVRANRGESIKDLGSGSLTSTASKGGLSTPPPASQAFGYDEELDKKGESNLQQIANGQGQGTEAQGNQQPGQDQSYSWLNDYMARLQEINRPYVEAMGRYLNEYPQLADDAFQQQRFMTGMAGASGNQGYNQLGNMYTPLANRAAQMGIAGDMRNTQLGMVNDYANVLGNSAVAQQLGLPAVAGLGGDGAIKSYADLQKALYELEARKYTADQRYAGTKYNADSRLAGSKYGADMGYRGRVAQGALFNGSIDPALREYLGLPSAYSAEGLNKSGGVTMNAMDQMMFGG